MIEAWTALYALLRDRKTEDLRKLRDATELLYKASCYLDAESYSLATTATERAMRAITDREPYLRCGRCGEKEVRSIMYATMTLRGPGLPMRAAGTLCVACGHREGGME